MKAVVFDYVGPLVHFSPGRKATIKKMFKSKLSIEEIRELWYPIWVDVSSGKISIVEFWQRLANRFNKIPPADADGQFLSLTKLRSKGIAKILEKLKQRYKLGLLSNYVARWGLLSLKKLGILKYFDAIVFSSDIGIRKPNPTVYKLVCQQLKVEPKECWYIGDEQEDIDAAKKLGMKTVFIPFEDADAKADFRIRNIRELLKVLQ